MVSLGRLGWANSALELSLTPKSKPKPKRSGKKYQVPKGQMTMKMMINMMTHNKTKQRVEQNENDKNENENDVENKIVKHDGLRVKEEEGAGPSDLVTVLPGQWPCPENPAKEMTRPGMMADGERWARRAEII